MMNGPAMRGFALGLVSYIRTSDLYSFLHSALGGLTTGDDHTQYVKGAGRSGGQEIIGGTGSGDDLTLKSTSHATKGTLEVADVNGMNIVVGAATTSDQFTLTRAGEAVASYGLRIHKTSATGATLAIGGLALLRLDGNSEFCIFGIEPPGTQTARHYFYGAVTCWGGEDYGSTDRVSLTVMGMSGMTANLQNWENSAGTRLASIGNDGHLELAEMSAPGTPSSGFFAIYPTSQNLFCKNDAGSTFSLTRRIMQIAVTDPNGSAITTGDGKAYFRINSELNGYNITAVAAHVTTVSSSGTVDVQIANVTDTVDLLSTKITIDANEKDSSTAATAAVINTANDDVATGDEWRIDIDAAGTGAKGLIVEITFSMP